MSLWGQPVLSVVFAGGYLALMTVLWLGLVVGVNRWGRGFGLVRPQVLPTEGRRVSICVPARDEAHNIEACVRAALATRWPDLEVIVVDDRSTDGTGALARQAGAKDPRLHVVDGTERPEGWAGKVWACSRAAGEATGDLLLFVDADVQLDPDAVAALVAEATAENLSLLSVFGTWKLDGFWERTVVPAVGWLIRGAVDLHHVNAPERPEAFANGQLILVERRDYESLDGHGAVRDQILDDVRLAEAFKRRGHRVGMRVAPWLFTVRPYRSLAEIYGGYAKNLYEGMGRKPLLGFGAVLFLFVGTLVPVVGLVVGLWARLAWGWAVPGGGWLVWLAGVCALQVVFRFRLERRDGRSGAMAWTHPVANAVLIAILLGSVLGVRVRWKGRSFVDGRATGA